MNIDFYPLSLMRNMGDIPLFGKRVDDITVLSAEKGIKSDIVDSRNRKLNIDRYWDLVYFMNELIEIYLKLYNPLQRHYGCQCISGSLTYMADNVTVNGSTIINDENGPVIISDGCTLNGFNLIEGPAFIGRETLLDNAIIRGPVITGKTCKLSGEIEESFIMDYVNKHHYGFIGHAVIEDWVNLGAGTTNSDLKNNYSSIRMYDGSKFIDTGRVKLGCIIGEHSKTAIGTMINTGTVIGPFCNVFGSMLRVKHLKPFSWGTEGHLVELGKLIELVKTVMGRRNIKPSDDYIAKIESLYGEISG